MWRPASPRRCVAFASFRRSPALCADPGNLQLRHGACRIDLDSWRGQFWGSHGIPSKKQGLVILIAREEWNLFRYLYQSSFVIPRISPPKWLVFAGICRLWVSYITETVISQMHHLGFAFLKSTFCIVARLCEFGHCSPWFGNIVCQHCFSCVNGSRWFWPLLVLRYPATCLAH